MSSAAPSVPSLRTALVAGATGLVGRALLPLLEESPVYTSVHVLLRRAAIGIEANPKLLFHTVAFAHLPQPFPAADDVYIALGTTIKVAGSQEAFRHVDFDYVVDTARAARAAGARRLAVVSALGADAGSRVFYNRVKGEMQDAIATLGYESVVIAQPSLLVGDRASLGQPVRSGEVWATRLLGPVMDWVPRGVRPIAASVVAQALLDATLAGTPGVHLLSSAKMQTHAAPHAVRHGAARAAH
jgi:uncharacterized protein YbjT (DUF2867 family)